MLGAGRSPNRRRMVLRQKPPRTQSLQRRCSLSGTRLYRFGGLGENGSGPCSFAQDEGGALAVLATNASVTEAHSKGLGGGWVSLKQTTSAAGLADGWFWHYPAAHPAAIANGAVLPAYPNQTKWNPGEPNDAGATNNLEDGEQNYGFIKVSQGFLADLAPALLRSVICMYPPLPTSGQLPPHHQTPILAIRKGIYMELSSHASRTHTSCTLYIGAIPYFRVLKTRPNMSNTSDMAAFYEVTGCII